MWMFIINKRIRKNETLFDLIGEAKEMLLDRSPQEMELIYAIAKLDSDERAAIIVAYKTIKEIERI